jgi:hypothetical protein
MRPSNLGEPSPVGVSQSESKVSLSHVQHPQSFLKREMNTDIMEEEILV